MLPSMNHLYFFERIMSPLTLVSISTPWTVTYQFGIAIAKCREKAGVPRRQFCCSQRVQGNVVVMMQKKSKRKAHEGI